MSDIQTVKVTIEKSDGEILVLEGKDAEKWREVVDAQATFAYVHDQHFPPMAWKKFRRPPPSTEYDHSIHSNPDAMVWAKFYQKSNPDCDLDVMTGWFANAMMAMHDYLSQGQGVQGKEPEIINGEVIIDWTTGDPKEHRAFMFRAYRNFFRELMNLANEQKVYRDNPIFVELLRRWKITFLEVDSFPRIGIEYPPDFPEEKK